MVASCRQSDIREVPFHNSVSHRWRDCAVLTPMVFTQKLKVNPEVIVSNEKIVV
jgi:hypothetical protein